MQSSTLKVVEQTNPQDIPMAVIQSVVDELKYLLENISDFDALKKKVLKLQEMIAHQLSANDLFQRQINQKISERL